MPRSLTCPFCNKRFQSPPGTAGRKVRCPGCDEYVAVEDDLEGLPEDEEDRPRRRRREAVDDRPLPRKKRSGSGWMACLIVLTLGLLGTCGLCGGIGWWAFTRDPVTLNNAQMGGGSLFAELTVDYQFFTIGARTPVLHYLLIIKATSTGNTYMVTYAPNDLKDSGTMRANGITQWGESGPFEIWLEGEDFNGKRTKISNTVRIEWKKPGLFGPR